MQGKHLLTILSATVFVACSAPGSPKLQTNRSDGQGPLIPDCKNVSSRTKPFEYDIRSYHSTWSSAWLEGMQAGFKEGLNLSAKASDRTLYKKQFAYNLMLQLFGIDGRNPPFSPFCMRFNASESEVRCALDEIVPLLDNKLVRDKEDFGLYGTEFIDRKGFSAKWRDRYVITVRETISGQTDVTVFRELLISRQGHSYDRAQSNGHNEAWLLQQIAAKVTK